jgi:5-formyltetrahydrofolate cyclo-ligase
MFNLGIDEMLVIGILAAFFVDAKKLVQGFKWIRTTRSRLTNLQFDIEEKVDNYLKVSEPHEPNEQISSGFKTNKTLSAIPVTQVKDSAIIDDKNSTTSSEAILGQDPALKEISQERARKIVQFRLSQLDSEEIDELSRDLIEELEHFTPLDNAQSIAGFMPLSDEVQYLSYLEEANAIGKDVYLPKVEGEILKFYHVQDFKELIRGKFGILEPKPDIHSLMRAPAEVFLIPGVAFGNRGERVGRGKGFYDKSLKDLKDSLKVGICFEKQVLSGYIAQNVWDISMDYIVTSQRIIHSTQANTNKAKD